MIIGSHVSFDSKEQLLKSVKECISYGANTFMFYTGAPQNTSRIAIDTNLTKKAYHLMKEHNIKLDNIIVHAPYIVNLANINNYDFSISFLKEEVERCNDLGIKYIVLHPGSATTGTREDAINDIASGLKIILDNKNDVNILLETMAGKGNEIGKNFEELKKIMELVNSPKLGVCLDTCHISDAGYDISNFDKVLEEFDKIIGLYKLKCIHINDSKNIKGSAKDRHENIGFGSLGFDNLIKIIYHPKLENIPKILETPYISKKDNDKEKIYPPYKFEIDMIKKKKFNNKLFEDIRLYYK